MQTLELKTENLIPLLQEQLASGATVGLGVTGTSMQPMLRNGKDSVLLRPVDAPKKGDILLYRRKSGQYVLHRVVALGEITLLCCGDNQWRKEPILPEQAIAVVCAYRRGEKEKSLSTLGYKFYVSLLPLRRIFCRLRDWLFR